MPILRRSGEDKVPRAADGVGSVAAMIIGRKLIGDVSCQVDACASVAGMTVKGAMPGSDGKVREILLGAVFEL